MFSAGILYRISLNPSFESESETARTWFTRSSFRTHSSRGFSNIPVGDHRPLPGSQAVEAYQAGVGLNRGVLSLGTRRIARTTKINAVHGDECPIAVDDHDS